MRRTRLSSIAALLGLAIAAATGGPAAAQQGVSMATGLTDFTTWTLFGSASAANFTPGNGFTYSQLALTQPGSNGASGAGFAPVALTMNLNQAFEFDFHFQIAGDDLRGDGLTFALAQAPGGGGSGSSLGYEALDRSVAFAVDTFNFTDEPESPSLQILQNGSIQPLAVTETGLGDFIRLTPAQIRTTVSFAPSGNMDATGTLTGSIVVYTQPNDPLTFDTYTVQSFVDLSSLVDPSQTADSVTLYYGFTASNGAASDGHFINTAAPVPEPASAVLWMLGLGGLVLQVSRRRLTRAS